LIVAGSYSEFSHFRLNNAKRSAAGDCGCAAALGQQTTGQGRGDAPAALFPGDLLHKY
jgi:hypothetical protein